MSLFKDKHLTEELNKFGKIMNDDGYINTELLFNILQNLEEEILLLKEQIKWKDEDIRQIENKLEDKVDKY